MANKELFILGAGFSYAVTNGTMPLLNGLTKELLDDLELEEEENLARIWHDYVVNPNIGNVKDPAHSNFEDIMTFLSSKFAYETYKDEHLKAALYQYITERIVAIFQMINLEKEILNDHYLLHFAKYLHRTKAEIFSFNYDLVLENLLKNALAGTDYFAPLYSIKRMPGDTDHGFFTNADAFFWKDSLKLYKLHGSINWMYDPDYPTGVQIVTSRTLPEYYTSLHYLLVPPTILKNFVFRNSLLDVQWQEFREKLQLAKKIFIIGYSIPKTDIATYYALKTCVQPDCEVYIVAKPTKDKIREWKQLFDSQNKQHHLHVLKEGFNENTCRSMGCI